MDQKTRPEEHLDPSKTGSDDKSSSEAKSFGPVRACEDDKGEKNDSQIRSKTHRKANASCTWFSDAVGMLFEGQKRSPKLSRRKQKACAMKGYFAERFCR